MFNRFNYFNSRTDGAGVLEVTEQRKEGQPALFVPLRRTLLRGEVLGPLAALTLVHTYGYTRAQCDKVLAAAYRFPLPGDAAVTGVRVRFGEVAITATLREREAAEEEYKEAMKSGKQAALLTRESPDVFILQLTGLQPEQEVVVETDYVQLARPEGAGWSLRVPLTTAPRYLRSDELTARHAQGQPLALWRDPGHRFALELTIRDVATVTSSTHALALETRDGATSVRLQDSEVAPDRDCVLAWQPRQAERTALQVWLHDDPHFRYFLALATPPAMPDSTRVIAREVLLLVDHSGSMHGPKWAAADWSVKSFLYGLQPRDAFSLGLFHNTIRWSAIQPLSATPAHIKEAIVFL